MLGMHPLINCLAMAANKHGQQILMLNSAYTQVTCWQDLMRSCPSSNATPACHTYVWNIIVFQVR